MKKEDEITKNEVKERNGKSNVVIIVLLSVIALVLVALLAITVIPMIQSASIKNAYNQAMKLFNEEEYEKAVPIFESIVDYEDSSLMLDKCKEEIVNKKNENDYTSAMQLYDEEKYEEAIPIFESLNGYRDSILMINRCNEKIIEKKNENTYNTAMQLYDEEKYEEAIPIFESVMGYKDSYLMLSKCNEKITEKKNESTYNAAIGLIEESKYEDAIKLLKTISTYKDSKDRINKCQFLIQKSKLVGITKGSIIKFGYCEQDNKTDNGYEEIEWLVLSVDGNKALVISKYAIDCQKYTLTYSDTTWDNCRLRYWLNDEFVNYIFSSYHQELISKSIVLPDPNPPYSTTSGTTTIDKLFILSADEAVKYFDSASSRATTATEYAKKKGANSWGSISGCFWWLRTPGYTQNTAQIVGTDGNISKNGIMVSNINVGVRPAMWIELPQ